MRHGHQYVLLLKLYFLENNPQKDNTIEQLSKLIMEVKIGFDACEITTMTVRTFFNDMIRENVLINTNNSFIGKFGLPIQKYIVNKKRLLEFIFEQSPSRLLYHIIYKELWLDPIWNSEFDNIRKTIPEVIV